MSIDQNKAVLQSGAEAFNDPARRSVWFDIHDPDVVAEGLAPQPLNLDGVKDFYTGLWDAFPDLHIAVSDMIGEGDKVAWRLNVTGTHTGEFRGIPATGVEVSFGAQYIFEFRNGRIVRRWTNFDRLGVMVQLGAIPAPV